MGSSGFVMQMLETFIYQAPGFLLYIGGIIFAMTRMKTAKTPAMLVVVSLSILLLSIAIFTIIQSYVVMQMNQGGVLNSMWIYRGTWFARTIIHTLAMALLIYAVFVGRNPAPHSDD